MKLQYGVTGPSSYHISWDLQHPRYRFYSSVDHLLTQLKGELNAHPHGTGKVKTRTQRTRVR